MPCFVCLFLFFRFKDFSFPDVSALTDFGPGCFGQGTSPTRLINSIIHGYACKILYVIDYVFGFKIKEWY